ncbi:hypothetical protein F5887DRAFT_1076366 [Amanita rubescens]|nr:hypothetical protein F5887DRAFT_1076366 [Amanita rubescens]
MPKKWERSKAQTEYLNGYVQGFPQAQMDNRLKRFHSELFEGWFKSWPEEPRVFGETWKKGDLLTEDNVKVLRKAIQTRQVQLNNYVRWRAAGKVVRTRASGVLKGFINKERKPVKRARKNQKLELYSQKYYETRFKDQVDREIADTAPLDETKKDFQKRKMTIYRKWRSFSWEKESEDVKEEIVALWNADENLDDEVADGEPDLDGTEDPVTNGYGGCIDQLGELLTSFLRDLKDETGWAFTILGGGLNRNGEVKIVASHIGKTAAGGTFPEVCDDYQHNVLQEFLAFVKLRHPIEERILCAQANNGGRSDTPSEDNVASHASADGTPEEQEASHQHNETTGTITEKKSSGPQPKKSGKRRRKEHTGKDVSDQPAGGTMPQACTGVNSQFASDISIRENSMNPPMLSHVGATVPPVLQSKAASLPVFQPNPTASHAVASTPSLRYSASTASFGYSMPQTTLGSYDNNWMPSVPLSFSTPMMQSVSLPYEDLSPMSKFLAMTDPNHQAYDAALVLTAMAQNPGLGNNLNLESSVHPPSFPNMVLTPRDINSHPCFGPDPSTLPCNYPDSSIPMNELTNGATETRVPSTISTSGPENMSVANAKGDKSMVPVKRSEEGRCGSAFGQRGFGGQSWGCLGGRESAEDEGERVEGVRSTEERRERKESNSERRWGDNSLTTTTYTMVYILRRHEVTM